MIPVAGPRPEVSFKHAGSYDLPQHVSNVGPVAHQVSVLESQYYIVRAVSCIGVRVGAGMAQFSGAVKLADLNDFIAPSQACVVNINGSKDGALQIDNKPEVRHGIVAYTS